MKLMAGIILAVAVSVHTVVAWDFAMAIAPMWHKAHLSARYFGGRRHFQRTRGPDDRDGSHPEIYGVLSST